MNGQLAIMSILQNDATFGAIVGIGSSAKIYYDEAMQTVTTPFAIIKTDGITPNDTKSGASTLDFDLVYITHFAATKKQVTDMSLAARNALDRTTGTKGGIIVIGLQFKDLRSDTERLIDKKVFTEEQLFQIMTQQ